MVFVYTYKWIFGISGYTPHKSLVTLDCSGKGVEDDPYIINKNVKPPRHMIIENSSDYILIEDFKFFSQIYIDNSSNIKISNIKTENLTTKKSLNITIEKCVITRVLHFKKTNDFSVNNCEINSLKLTKIRSKDFTRRNILDTNKVNKVYL